MLRVHRRNSVHAVVLKMPHGCPLYISSTLRFPLFLARAVATRVLDGIIHATVIISGKRVRKCSKWLTGQFAPQPNEVTVPNARVSGRLPMEIQGMFVTVASNPRHLPNGGYHLFDGDGALTVARIRDQNSASFSHRWIRTEKYYAEQKLGFSRSLSFAAMTGRSGLLLLLLRVLRKKVQNLRFSESTANTNIIVHNREIYAMWEQGPPYVLIPDKEGHGLQCTKMSSIRDRYEGPFSAHPVHHVPTGKMFAVSYAAESKEHDAIVVVVDSRGNLDRLIPLRLGRKPMIHDAACTDNFVVIYDFPMLFDPLRLLRKNCGVFKFHKDKPSRFGLLPVDAKDEKDITWFESDACFSFHTIASWDTDRGATLFLLGFDEFDLNLDYDSPPGVRVIKYDFDVSTGKCTGTNLPLDLSEYYPRPLVVELPITNKSKQGSSTNFVYFTAIGTKGAETSLELGLVKYNLKRQAVEGLILHAAGTAGGVARGEAAFVARKDALSEDDGYLLVLVEDEESSVKLAVYDALKMSNKPVASIQGPDRYHVPTGFHSEFIPQEILECR